MEADEPLPFEAPRHMSHASYLSNSRHGHEDYNKNVGASDISPQHRSSRAIIEDLYQLFGERPELSDTRERHEAANKEDARGRAPPGSQFYGLADVDMDRYQNQ